MDGVAKICLLIAVLGTLGGCRMREAEPGDLSGGQELVGAWSVPAVGEAQAQRVHFFSDGSFLVDEGPDGTVEHVGYWTVEDNERLIVAYWDWAEICPLLPGAYEFAVSGDRLELTEISDDCEQRQATWPQAWSRVSPPSRKP